MVCARSVALDAALRAAQSVLQVDVGGREGQRLLEENGCLTKRARPHGRLGLFGQRPCAMAARIVGQRVLRVDLQHLIVRLATPGRIRARGPRVGLLGQAEVAVQVRDLEHVEGIQTRRCTGLTQGVERAGVVEARRTHAG